MSFLNTILNVIFPVNCISCGKNNIDLCLKCISNCQTAQYEDCKWIFPIFDYRDPLIKKSIWLLKYKGKKKIANIFAIIMHDRIIEELSDLTIFENFKDPILIPVPLAPKRKRERGFNQAEIICKELIKLDENLQLENNILIKQKDTIHQAKIKNRNERLKNLINSFTVKNPEIIKNKNIILIDDVCTTGATLNEAKKILKQAGARKIIAFTVAH
jgi:competence protein ComFC